MVLNTFSVALAPALGGVQGNRLEMGREGFELNMQAKGRSDGDKCVSACTMPSCLPLACLTLMHLDVGAHARSGQRCTEPLFQSVNLAHPFWSLQTTKCFMRLLDNYERATGTAETVLFALLACRAPP